MALVTLACVALAACPAAPPFQGSNADASDAADEPDTATADTTFAPDTSDALDASDAPDASDTAVPTDTSDEVDVGPCVPDCAAALAAGTCGDDGCGRPCGCPSGSACDAGTCACLTGCKVEVDVAKPAAAALDSHGTLRVALLRSPTEGRFDLVLATALPDGRFARATVAANAGRGAALQLALEPDDRPVLVAELPLPLAPTGATDVFAFEPTATGDGWDQAPLLDRDNLTATLPTLARGADGVLRAVVLDHQDLILHLFERRGAGVAAWTETLASEDPIGSFEATMAYPGNPAFVFDADDEVRYAHRCCGAATSADLVYGRHDVDGWHSQTVRSMTNMAGTANGRVGLALDPGDRPHIVYQTTVDGVGRVVHVAWTGNDWTERTVAVPSRADAVIGQVLAFASDPSGALHVALSRGEGLEYRRFSGGSWGAAVPLDDVVMASDGAASIVVDPAGRAHVLATDNDQRVWWWTP